MDKILNKYGNTLVNNKDLILSVVKNYHKALSYAGSELLNDNDFVFSAATINGNSLAYANEIQRDNFDIVLAAVSRNGNALKWASNNLKNNEQIVKAAVSNKGNALKHASAQIRSKKNIVFEAVKNGCSIEFVPNYYLNNDDDIISTILNRNTEIKISLSNSCLSIRSNRDIILKAVKNNGMNLEFASPDLQNDIEIMKNAGLENFNALKYTTLGLDVLQGTIYEILKDYNFRWYYKVRHSIINDSRYSVIAAIYKDECNWRFINQEHRNDKELMLFAIKLNARNYNYVSETLRNDRNIVMKIFDSDENKYETIERYIYTFCTVWNNDNEVLKAINYITGISLQKLENYDQYINATSIMEKWFCELPTKTLEYLSKCKTLFYPGAYHDFSTLQFFMENSSVTNFYYCEYMNREIDESSIYKALRTWFNNWENYSVRIHSQLGPKNFGQEDWRTFWYPDPEAEFGSDKELSFCTRYEIKKNGKTWNLFYFGTEGIATYEVLLKNKINLDIIVTQDHGLGGCWTSFCKNSLLETISKRYKKLPKILLTGSYAWDNYVEVSEWFGEFGMHNGDRKLFKHKKKLITSEKKKLIKN